MLLAAFGITAIFMAVPYAYDTLKICGAIYLLYIAWQSIKPGGRSIFHPKNYFQVIPLSFCDGIYH